MSVEQLWCGRTEDAAFNHARALLWHHVVRFSPPQTPASKDSPTKQLAVIGYPSDEGARLNQGRVGAAEGPTYLRKMLASVAWPWQAELYDCGNTPVYSDLPATQHHYQQKLAGLLRHSHAVLSLGGSHDIAVGSYLALAQHLPPKQTIGIINIDAHLDLRSPATGPSSGTPFRQIAQWCDTHQRAFHYVCLGVSRASNSAALFEFANHKQCTVISDTDFSFDTAKIAVAPMLRYIDNLYVTVCMDAFPGYAAPGVSAPAALGVDPIHVIKLLNWLGNAASSAGVSWQLADIAELNPRYDIDCRTARLAARLGFTLAQAMLSNTTPRVYT